jgi:hypothetical protein
MKSLGRRELLKTLATISGAAAVTNTARGRTLKPAYEPARCSGNTLNVILHGMFAITADDQNITLVMPRVAGHYYAAGSFGVERPLRLNGAEPLSYTLSVPGWKPSRPVVSDRTDIVVHDKGGFHFDTEAFCNITMPATSGVFRPSVANRGKRRIFAGSAGVASEPDAIPLVYVFQYTYAGGLPSLGDFWSADPAGGGAHNLHLWAAPPFFADHAHTQEGLEAFNNLFDPNLGLRFTDEQFDSPVTNIQSCGVTYPEILSMPEARLQATQRQPAALSQVSMSPFRSNFLGSRSRTQVAPMFTGHVRTCFNIWVVQ